MKPTLAAMLGLLALSMTGHSAAQTYPEKAVHLIVGFPPGSQPDTVARLLGRQLAQQFPQPVLVENITGAAGNIAAERVAKAPADGYTAGLLSQTHIVVNPNLYRLAYDPVKDFAPISEVTLSPNMLVVANSVPASTLSELVALAKAQPGSLTFASSGSGTATHLAGELFNTAAGVQIRHIPYKGVVEAIPDLIAGRVSTMFSTIAVALPLVRDGKLRALAVTSLNRSSVAGALPTISESGYPGFELTNWYGLLAPARTPVAVVRRIHAETVKALATSEVRARLTELGMEVIGNSPEEFAAVIHSEIPRWSKLIKDAGISTE